MSALTIYGIFWSVGTNRTFRITNITGQSRDTKVFEGERSVFTSLYYPMVPNAVDIKYLELLQR